MLNNFEKNVVNKMAKQMVDYGDAEDITEARVQAKHFFLMVKNCEAEETLDELFN